MHYRNSLLTYIKYRQDISFSERPFNEVDALILNIVAFLSLPIPYDNEEEYSLHDVLNQYFSKDEKEELGLIIPKEMLILGEKPVFREATIEI